MEPTGKIEQFIIQLFYYRDAPAGAHGIITQDGTPGKYTIGLNSDESEIQNYITFLHEVSHIFFNDFESGKDAAEIERLTHARLLTALRIIEDQDKENQPA